MGQLQGKALSENNGKCVENSWISDSPDDLKGRLPGRDELNFVTPDLDEAPLAYTQEHSPAPSRWLRDATLGWPPIHDNEERSYGQ